MYARYTHHSLHSPKMNDLPHQLAQIYKKGVCSNHTLLTKNPSMLETSVDWYPTNFKVDILLVESYTCPGVKFDGSHNNIVVNLQQQYLPTTTVILITFVVVPLFMIKNMEYQQQSYNHKTPIIGSMIVVGM